MLPETDDPETVGPESADTEASDTNADDAATLSVTADVRRARRREVVRAPGARGEESKAAAPSSGGRTDSEGDAESSPEADGPEISTAGGAASARFFRFRGARGEESFGVLSETDDPETADPEAAEGAGSTSDATAGDAATLSVTADARRARRREAVRDPEARGGESKAAASSSAGRTDSEGDTESPPEADGPEISTAGGAASARFFRFRGARVGESFGEIPETDDPETADPESAAPEASDATAGDAPVLSVTADVRRERRREAVRAPEVRGGVSKAAVSSSAGRTDSEGDTESPPEAGGSEISTAGGAASARFFRVRGARGEESFGVLPEAGDPETAGPESADTEASDGAGSADDATADDAATLSVTADARRERRREAGRDPEARGGESKATVLSSG